jgi:cytochrome oxidase Cu insertion factor (SCO1/SenC/PrrC family)
MRVHGLLILPLAAACASSRATDKASSPDTDTASSSQEPCGPDADVGLEVGQCAPDFQLPDAAGRPFTLSSLRGKVALVDISAVW